MSITVKRDEIISILCEMHKISGLRISLHGTDFKEIAAYPAERLPFCAAIQKNENEYALCVECDKISCKRIEADGKTLIYKCRYGLTEVICPLYNFGTLTGYITMGQVACHEADKAALARFRIFARKSHIFAARSGKDHAFARSDLAFLVGGGGIFSTPYGGGGHARRADLFKRRQGTLHRRAFGVSARAWDRDRHQNAFSTAHRV